MRDYRIAAIPGDGIGVEVIAAGLEVLDRRSQAELLADFGFEERLATIADPGARDPLGQMRAASARNAARSIVDPQGMGAFSVLLSKYSSQDDIVVGSPVAGRNRSETENLIGIFVNTLVLRTKLAGNPSFSELLAQIRSFVP